MLHVSAFFAVFFFSFLARFCVVFLNVLRAATISVIPSSSLVLAVGKSVQLIFHTSVNCGPQPVTLSMRTPTGFLSNGLSSNGSFTVQLIGTGIIILTGVSVPIAPQNIFFLPTVDNNTPQACSHIIVPPISYIVQGTVCPCFSHLFARQITIVFFFFACRLCEREHHITVHADRANGLFSRVLLSSTQGTAYY